MLRHTLKLLVLSTALAVTPASAGEWNFRPAAYHDASGCPYERARIAAAAAAWSADRKGETTITLIDRVPPDSSLFIGPGSRFLTP
jgi:hypothetical protein